MPWTTRWRRRRSGCTRPNAPAPGHRSAPAPSGPWLTWRRSPAPGCTGTTPPGSCTGWAASPRPKPRRNTTAGRQRTPHERRRLRRRSPPGAAQATGPLFRPQGCWRIALRATAVRAALDPGDLGGPWQAGHAVRPRACPARRAAQARVPAAVTSSQQSHLAKLRHTKPGVHEIRDAPNA